MLIERILYRNNNLSSARYRPWAACAALVMTWGAASAEAGPIAGSVELERRTLDIGGGTLAYELGTLYVPENRASKTSAVIGIGFARLRATGPSHAPPIVVLPGGPGYSMRDAFTGANPSRLTMLRAHTAAADVIVFDQRGFSDRGTVLALPTIAPLPLDQPTTMPAYAAWWRAFAKAAIAANPARDLSAYNVVECAADVDDLRKALGYDKISLLGGSFGSQWSFAVMRLHPEIVARALLSAVEPLDNGFDMPSYVRAALQRIASDADRDPGLQPYLPPGGLMTAVRELGERFARGPVTVEVSDPKTGKRERVVLGLGDLQGALVATTEPSEWPASILSLYHGRYEVWARAELAARRGSPFSSVINPLIDSGIGVSATRRHQLEADPAVAVLGPWDFAPHLASRAAWPTPDLGDALRTPQQSSIPVVFVNGDWDINTPVENMLQIAPYFSHSHTIVVHRTEHAGPFYLARNHPAVISGIVEFFRSGSMAGLPAEIDHPAPKFAVPAFPPPHARR